MNKTLINGENKKLKHLTVEWPKGILKGVQFPESSGNRKRWKRITIQMSVGVSEWSLTRFWWSHSGKCFWNFIQLSYSVIWPSKTIPATWEVWGSETDEALQEWPPKLLPEPEKALLQLECGSATQVALLIDKLVVITPITGLLVQFNDTIWCSLTI